MLQNTNSAKALSGDIDLNSPALSGLVCILKLAANTNEPTVEINPAKKALYGKVPTSTQCTN